MSAETNKKETNTQTFTFETVAVLVAVIKDKGGNLGMKDYELMASLDNSRSASGFDHLFRKVKNRANELLEAKNGGAGAGAVTTPKKKGGAASKSATPGTGETTGGKKRGRKSKKADAADDEEESPTKKVKAEAADEEDPFDQVKEDGEES